MRRDNQLFDQMLLWVADGDESSPLSWAALLDEKIFDPLILETVSTKKFKYHCNLLRDSGFVDDFGITWSGNNYLDMLGNK